MHGCLLSDNPMNSFLTLFTNVQASSYSTWYYNVIKEYYIQIPYLLKKKNVFIIVVAVQNGRYGTVIFSVVSCRKR